MDYSGTGKQFVFVVVLLGIFFTLVVTMPSGFYVTAPDYDEIDYPDHYTIEDLQTIRFTGNSTGLEYGTLDDFTIEREDMDNIDIRVMWPTGGERQFYFERYWYVWIWRYREAIIYSSTSWPVPYQAIINNVDESGNVSRFEMNDQRYSYIIDFVNNGTYSSLEASLEDDVVSIFVGMGWDYESGALSGWDLVTRLLMFQAPDITTEMNFVIAIPIWAMIGFLIFSLLMMFINALPFT